MSTSILTSIKKILGVDQSDTDFDADIVLHINSVFVTLNQLGIGPAGGFAIEDESTLWDAYLGSDLNLNNIKTYVSLRVRLLFDPPTTSYLVTALQEQVRELEWRINVRREDAEWTAPVIPPDPLCEP